MINRSAIIVRAKEPFLQWLRQLPDPVGPDMTLASINEEPTVYLVPEYGYIDEQEELLAQAYGVIFENELGGWWTKEADWPKRRNLKLFLDWFEVTFHSLIEDLVDMPLVDDE
jgi:hypothetical protein